MKPLTIPALVGSKPPAHWDVVEAHQKMLGDDAGPHRCDVRRSPLVDPGLDWAKLGFEPRWVGDDTVDCVVALQPSVFHSQGADAFDRFRQGAGSRGELALVVSTVGADRDGDQVRRFLSAHDDSVFLGKLMCSIASRPLGNGARVQIDEGLGDADRDLGLRLLNHAPGLNWWVIELRGMQTESAYGSQSHPPEGRIEPILVTPLGETVVGAWVSPDEAERRYIVPTGTPWELVLDWLAQKGLPEYVPGAMRRARAPVAWPVELLTPRERQASEALEELEVSYRKTRDELQATLAQARQDADQIRDGLLYGTGKDLVHTVALILAAAGIETVDLDELLGDTRNADLLCSYHGAVRLVEVKSASGSPSERLYSDLLRHLREWPSLPEATPVDGGALILNYEHRKAPLERSREPYTRQDFLASQTEPIVTTWQLFEAWRDERWEQIRAALLRPFDSPTENTVGPTGAEPSAHVQPAARQIGAASTTSRPHARWWRGRGRA